MSFQLVRALLQEQHDDLADLLLSETVGGWDNYLFRLGDGLAVRLPRRALATDLIVHEQRWLSLLAARLPLPIPVPVRRPRSAATETASGRPRYQSDESSSPHFS